MENQLYFENCKSVLERMPDGSVDLFLQDPPFEVTDSAWDKGFIVTLPEMWELWQRKGKLNCPFVFKATYPFAIDLINSNRAMFRYEWIWEKDIFTNFVNAKHQPLRCVEYLFVFYKEKPTYHPILRKTSNAKSKTKQCKPAQTQIYSLKNKVYSYTVSELGNPTNLIKVGAEKKRFVTNVDAQNRHPNRTNPELWKYFIRTYTNEGDLVFDGYAGSGSVAQAAIALNRRWIACENSEEYYEDTKQRLLYSKEIHELGYAPSELKRNTGSLFFGI